MKVASAYFGKFTAVETLFNQLFGQLKSMRPILAIIFMTFGLGACVQNNTGGQAGPQLLKVMAISKKNCTNKGFEAGTSQWSVCYEKELAEGKRKEFGVGGFST